MRSKRKKERQQQQDTVKQARKQEERTFKKTIVHIAETLGETEWKPRTQIERIVEHLGADFAMTKLAEAEHVEAQGGMMLSDGSRRRTKGGVFFYLVRQWLKEAKRQPDIKEIFYKNLEPPPDSPTDEQPEQAAKKQEQSKGHDMGQGRKMDKQPERQRSKPVTAS